MKNIIITGAESYIGTSFENYVRGCDPEFKINTVDLIDGTWRKNDFSGYDAVLHVAGIAHSDVGKASDEIRKFYYEINTNLAIETAQKAKTEGVKQFIFMSSAIVYGDSAPIGENKVISKDTIESPSNFYGDSKLQAENGIKELEDSHFKVVIIRSPMVYGKESKGNYRLLRKIALKLPLFPYVDNRRSMLYIENLCEFISLMIVNEERGTFWPQNKEYTNTSELVKTIAEMNNKRVILVKGMTGVLKVISKVTDVVEKAFGSFCYEQSLSEYKIEYRKYNLKQSIIKVEENNK